MFIILSSDNRDNWCFCRPFEAFDCSSNSQNSTKYTEILSVKVFMLGNLAKTNFAGLVRVDILDNNVEFLQGMKSFLYGCYRFQKIPPTLRGSLSRNVKIDRIDSYSLNRLQVLNSSSLFLAKRANVDMLEPCFGITPSKPVRKVYAVLIKSYPNICGICFCGEGKLIKSLGKRSAFSILDGQTVSKVIAMIALQGKQLLHENFS